MTRLRIAPLRFSLPALLLVLCAVSSSACSTSDGDRRLRVGTDGPGGDGDGQAGAGGSPGALDGGGPGDRVLAVHVEDLDEVTVELVTLACMGDCAELQAVAEGGNPPYSFAWDDGSTDPRRTVCLEADAALRVSATDTAIEADEFHYQATTATANVSARVLDCADAGPGDAGPAVACIENPSFEGPVTPNQLTAFDAPPWNACYAGGFITYAAIADANLWPTQAWSFPGASDGATYLALGQQGALFGRASQTLCEPLAAGQTLSFLVDLAKASSDNAASEALSQVIQILGGNSECNEALELWRSPELTTAWTTHCVELTPTETITTLAFRALGSDGGGEMEGLVDHLVPVAHCP